MEPTKPNSDSPPAIAYGDGDIKSTRATSSVAMPCATPTWLTRITGQKNNYANMGTSQSRSLGTSFSDPALVGVGCTPPKSNHNLIIVGSSDGKPKITVSYSASNSPIIKRRNSPVIVGSGKRTWSGSGANHLNFLDAASPSVNFYNLLRGQQRCESNEKENALFDEATSDVMHMSLKDQKLRSDRLKSPNLIKENEMSDVKDLTEKIVKVVPTGSHFPVATKASLDGLKKEAINEAEDDLFAMDDHHTSGEEQQCGQFPEKLTHRKGKSEIEESGKMTLTQQILEKGLPENWFFQANETDISGSGGALGGREQIPDSEKKTAPIQRNESVSNPNQMRGFNVWAPQNL